MKFEASCLKTFAKPYTPNEIISFYIVYETKLWLFHNTNKFSVRNSLFGTVKLTKNADPDKYSYSGCGILFDIRGSFSLKIGVFSRNVIIFGTDMS